MSISDQGISKENYYVVPRMLIFLFNEQGRVLLLKGSPYKRRWAGVFNGIGGHVEAGEDVMEAALRELAEETGITNVELVFCGQLMINASQGAGVALFVFKGTYLDEEPLSSEDGELMWLSLEELDRYPIMEDLHELLPRVATFKTGDAVMIGKYTFEAGGKLRISFSHKAFEED